MLHLTFSSGNHKVIIYKHIGLYSIDHFQLHLET